MDEAELRRRAQHVRPGELVGGGGGLDRFEPRERGGVHERDVVAEHRDGVRQRRRAGREPPDARVDRLRDRQRAERFDLLHALGADRRLAARAGGAQLVEQLAQEERVAVRDARAGGAEGVVGVRQRAPHDRRRSRAR